MTGLQDGIVSRENKSIYVEVTNVNIETREIANL